MTGNSSTFSLAALARAKVVLMGPPAALYHRVMNSVRSLQETDYFSTDRLPGSEAVSRPPVSPARVGTLAGLRHWFWTRRTSRGFVLAGFPTSRAQALTFDAWLDERDESLTACLWLDARDGVDPGLEGGRTWLTLSTGATEAAEYYAERGVLFTIDAPDASDDSLARVASLVAPLVADR